MIRSFRNQGTEDVFNGKDSKAARMVCPPDVVRAARRRLGYMLLSGPPLRRFERPQFRDSLRPWRVHGISLQPQSYAVP